jgi:putative phage-type endonuclease
VPGTDAWHAARQRKIGGTAARVIMGVDPWTTEYELWEVLTGRREPPPLNPAMARGLAREPEARAHYEATTGRVVRPAFAVHREHPWAIASLDGRTFDGDGLVEIKCPSPPVHAAYVAAGAPPPPYAIQIQHYLWVTGALWCDFVSYCPDADPPWLCVRVYPEGLVHHALATREAAWWARHLRDDVPPAKGPRDRHERDDPAWLAAAAAFREADAACAAWEARRTAARETLLALLDEGVRAVGGGVCVTPYEQRGTLDWKALVAAATAAGIDVEQFRRPAQTIVRVTVERPAS